MRWILPQKKRESPLPVVEAKQAAVKIEPVVLRLRREYKSWMKGRSPKMLAAKNIFDAERNPGGNFGIAMRSRTPGIAPDHRPRHQSRLDAAAEPGSR